MVNLDSLFRPRSAAVIGASKSPGKVGNSILLNLINSKYRGEIYPINPKETEIAGLRCYRSISEVKAELAIIVIPAAGVLSVADECGRSGVKSLIVITSGFKEIGGEGARLERELKGICQRHNMNLVGPNCLGVMDTHTPMNASFAPAFAIKGSVAFISQSGALGTAILDLSLQEGLGFSKFISLGNKAGLDETDFMENLAYDPDTKVILCYAESISDGPKFMSVARKVSKIKPIIIFKSGTSAAGAKAASSHTGSLAGNDQAYETAFRQTGVIRVKRFEDLFTLAQAFATQPIPKGDRIAVVTNAGGPGIVVADNIELYGLKIAQLEPETTQSLKEGLPKEASVHNPVDVMGDARADRYAFAVEKVVADGNVDSVAIVLTPQAVTEPEATACVIAEAKSNSASKPLVTAFFGGGAVEAGCKTLKDAGVATYTFPEDAVIALNSLVRYGQWQARPDDGFATDVQVDSAKVREIFDRVRGEGRRMLLGSEAGQVAAAYGIPAAPSVLAKTALEAASAACDMGFPVVLKLAAPKITHKTDLGGVKLGLKSEDAVRAGFEEILRNLRERMPDAEISGIEVQKMMPPGSELIIGMARDPQFGPMIMFGLGGIYVNLLKDVSFRLAYGLTRVDIEDMIKETKAYTIIRGFRGEAPRDMEAIMDAIARIARLTLDFPEIKELDINPIFAYTEGVSALDVKIALE